MHRRSGNLFNRPVKRIMLENETDFGLNLYYIHHNARKHGIVKDFKIYPWHSYHELISDEQSILDKEFVSDWSVGRKLLLSFMINLFLRKILNLFI